MNSLRILEVIFGKWFFITYFLFGILAGPMLYQTIPTITIEDACFMTIGLMTGSDPYSFTSAIRPHFFLWNLTWAIHIASWLFLPALVRVIVSKAAEDIRKDQILRASIHQWLSEAGVAEEDQRQLTQVIRMRIDEATHRSN